MDKKKKKNWLNEKTILVKKIIIINFFVVVGIILTLEALIRIFNIVGLQGYDKQAFYSEHGITFSKPNNTFKVFDIKSKADINGFRIPLQNYLYDNRKNSILILGDSVTYGVGVKEKDTFVGILRNRLIKNNLYNTAIFGHNIESYLYIIKKNNKKFGNEINQIVIFLCLNDIVSYQGVLFEKKLKKKKENNNFQKIILNNTFALKLNVFLRERSGLFVLFKNLLTDPVERHYNYMRELYESEKNLVKFKNTISEISNFAKKNNIKYKYVLLPYAHQIINNCEKKFLKPQEIIKEIFDRENLFLNDYTNDFCKISNNKDLFLKYDPVHLSKYGHKYVSDLLIQDEIFN